MKEQFVTYEIALKLKELGFDEECLMLWEHTDFWTNLVRPEEFKKVVSERYCQAPLWQQVIDWLRRKHKIDIYIYPSYYDSVFSENRKLLGYFGIIQSIGIDECNLRTVNAYEEARKQVILKALEIIKQV